MSENDSPTGSTGGPVTVPALKDLPEKMRVHALAKLIGHTSREVLAVLAGLGHETRSAASSVERKLVEQVISALVPGSDGEPAAVEAPVGQAASNRDLPAAPDLAAAVDLPANSDIQVAEAPSVASSAPEPVAALMPVFAPAAPLFQAPTRPATRPAARAEPEPVEEPAEPPAPRRRRRARGEERAAEALPTADDVTPEVEAPAGTSPVEDQTDDTESPDDAQSGVEDPDDDESDASRRRRRRGRRGRGRGRGGDEGDDSDTTDSADGSDAETAESDAEAGEETDEAEDEESEDESEGSRRRRRRRRRRGSDEGAEPTTDDPPGTVTRVRAPREAREDDGDGVQSVRGSTRLEAKRQRRRDGRDAGRRRQPILSEAEFLARRESVERTMVVRERANRVEIGVLEDEVLVEHFVTGHDGDSIVGNIYLGRVQNVLPSMEAAFVDIGRGRNAVLYAGEVDWDAAGLGGKARRIEQALSSGDSVLVQVTKDPIGHKGARLTTQLSMAGRFLVYVPAGGAAGISRKLPDVERKRLKDMLRDIVPSEAGVIIRTASEGVSQEALERDVRRLQAQWEAVKTRSAQTGPGRPKAPALLYEEPDLLIKVVRDQFNEDFSRLVVQGDDAWDTLHGYLAHVAPELAERMHRHVGNQDVFAAHRIDEQLLKALDRKVWLPSGGTLVIDRTEAMTVVDVNTGKFTGSGGNLEETVTRNNLEAAEEIVRQLRLRDIGGIIVVDFIDMVLEANRDLVLKRLTECLARDRTRHQVAEVTSLGLVQMTRKRVGGGLLEHFSTPCEHCRGRGVVIDADAVESTDVGRAEQNGGGRRGRGAKRRGDGETNGHHGGRGTNGSDPGLSGDHTTVVAATAVIAAAGRGGVDRPSTEAFVDGEAGSALGTADGADADRAVAVEVALVAEAAETLAVAEAVRAVDAVEAVAPVDAGSAAEVETGAETAAAPAPRARRRGRVTRTAGAPTATAGESPVAAVLTVPTAVVEPTVTSAADTSESPAASAAEAELPAAPPEPAATARPRRTRRAASRPAGPPVESTAGDPV